MPKTLCLLAASVLTSLASHAQTTAPTPLLWQTCDNDSCLYLLGSMHLLRPDDLPLAPEVTATLQKAATVVFEVPAHEMESPELMAQFAHRAINTSGQPLPPALLAKLQRWESANHHPSLIHFKPWLIGLTVANHEWLKYGMRPEHGMDLHLSRQARALGKPQAALETSLAQLQMLEDMPWADQLQALDETLTDALAHPEKLRQLHQSWRRGDARAMYRNELLPMQREHPALYQKLIVQRNQAWLPKLQAHLQGSQDVLAVVGALHLVGPDGVVQSLRQRGHRVSRVCPAQAANCPQD